MAEVVAVLLPPPPPSPPAAFFSWPSLNYVLVNYQYANYFMQKVIKTCDEWQHKIILECLRCATGSSTIAPMQSMRLHG
uniref:Uncharacterized protein n=1 Tax=Oryza nivara TaxID=4536 RepID=A0A0E0HCM5_ORYNI